MTVKELIEKLKTFDENAEVALINWDDEPDDNLRFEASVYPVENLGFDESEVECVEVYTLDEVEEARKQAVIEYLEWKYKKEADVAEVEKECAKRKKFAYRYVVFEFC